jgi:diguanylate cyclase
MDIPFGSFSVNGFNNPDYIQKYAELKAAIAGEAGHSLILHYQPICALQTGFPTLTGFEGLARWQHPEKGLIYPGDFIEFAKQTGLIDALFDRTFQLACNQGAQWLQINSQLKLAVNVSAAQLGRPHFAETLHEMATYSGLDSSQLQLEITENELSESDTAINAILQRLKAHVTIALDDFGVAFSSFQRLAQIDLVDVLKLDRSLLPEGVTHDRSLKICASLVNLAHELQLEVVAEGLETADQVAMMKAIGCDFGQGYYLGKPRSPEQIEGMWLVGANA